MIVFKSIHSFIICSPYDHLCRPVICLIFLYARLHQIQMSFFEAVKTTVSPLAWVGFLCIFVSALLDFWFDNSFVFTLTQLFHQMFHIEASLFIEQSHFAKDALDVALSLFIIWEIEFFVFVDLVFGYLKWCHTLWTISIQILCSLDFPFGGAYSLRIKRIFTSHKCKWIMD